MALISSSIPNLINGISQQPPSLRLKTQSQLQLNGLSSVVSGLSKRPPTQHVARLVGADNPTNPFIHTIRRDENEFYTLIVTGSQVLVYDQTGASRTVNGNATYLTGLTNPAEQLAAITIADYTFLLNKTKTVRAGANRAPARNKEALVYVKQGDYKTVYSVSIKKGSYIYRRSIEAMSSTQSSTSLTATAERSIQTERLAKSLIYSNAVDTNHYGQNGGGRTTASSSDPWAGLQNNISSTAAPSGSIPGLRITQYGNVIHYESTDGEDFDIRVSDTRGDTHVFAFKGQTADFKKLPPEGPDGFVIGVVGDNTKGQDDYFVKLTSDEGTGTQVWKETVEEGVIVDIDAYTMPHQLKRNADGSFTLEVASYARRKVGNDDTNPMPSFIGHKLSDIFFHRNRLGVLSDENVIFSEAGEFSSFNFFRRTTLTGLDTDPIDVAVSNNKVSILKHAVPFNESLLLFSDLTQFRLDSSDLLTPSTVSIDVTTQFEASLRASPVGAGRYVFFATKKGQWSGIREYYVDLAAEVDDAADITAHVPEYLDGEVTKICASSNEDTLLVTTSGSPNCLYVYRYYWQGQEKLQASWSKWELPGTVYNVEFDKSDIYLLMGYSTPTGTELHLEKISLGADPTEEITTGWPILLDRRNEWLSGEDLAYSDMRTIFVTEDGTKIGGATLAALYDNARNTRESGTRVFYGIPYAFRYVFSEQVPKINNEPVTTGNLKIRSLTLNYTDTGYFETRVTPPHRDTKISTFTGRVLGDGSNQLNDSSVTSGSYKFSVFSGSKDCRMEIFSDSYKPCQFQSAEWEGFYTLRSQRT